jgi:hypothetical protein
MTRPSALWLTASLLILATACGKPKERSGAEAQFVAASMGGTAAPAAPAGPAGPDRPLAADLAVEPVAMLVMFNRLKTPEKLEEALNKKAGQFSRLDLDKDSTPDPLTVAARATPDGHAFEIRVRPTTGEYVVATMMFDPEWGYLGHYSGLPGGAASTTGAPLPVPAAVGATIPVPVAVAPAPVATPTATPAATLPPGVGVAPPVTAIAADAAPTAAIGTAPPVQALPTGSP